MKEGVAVSVRMKHQPNTKDKVLFVGPRSEEQKPSLCYKCGQPVGYRYRVYKKEWDKHTGKEKVVQGQWEAAHIDPSTNQHVFFCPEPSMLDELIEKINKRAEEAANRGGYNEYGEFVGSGKKKDAIHMIRGSGSEAVIHVMCGAKGSLWTSLDKANVTCSNCKLRLGDEANRLVAQKVLAKVGPPTHVYRDGGIQIIKEGTGGQVMATQEEIKAKIAAARKKKEEAGGNGSAAGVSLTGGDEGAPMPKPTVSKGVAKRQVATGPKAEAGPKVLNLCGCGCGAGVKSRFQPGHDAKLHGWMRKLEKGGMSLADLPQLVREGMYKGAKQTQAKGEGGVVVLGAVLPTVEEADYLEKLKGKGGQA